MTGLLAELYERCELEAKKPVANDSGQYLFAAVNIRKYSPANVGMAHSNQLNFLEHSEEPYNNHIYFIVVPKLFLKQVWNMDSCTKVSSACNEIVPFSSPFIIPA